MTTLSLDGRSGFVDRAVLAETLQHDLATWMKAFAELTKPRITTMVLFCAAAGYWMTAAESRRGAPFLCTLIGTGLLAAGSGALNQGLERNTDALMRRTRRRPIPSGRLATSEGLAFGAVLSLTGVIALWAGVNVVAAAAGFLTIAVYLGVYTPLKTRSSSCVLAGAVAGAMPPVIGSLAADPSAIRPAVTLFGILLVWQMPHVYSIALMYRDDYERGGLRMLPATACGASAVASHIVTWSAVLIPVSLAPAVLGLTGAAYVPCALVLGAVFVHRCTRLLREPTVARARGVLLASVAYLPLLVFALVVSSR